MGPRLKRLRRELGLTQQAMADDLAISPSYVALLERNQRPFTADLLLRLARTTGSTLTIWMPTRAPIMPAASVMRCAIRSLPTLICPRWKWRIWPPPSPACRRRCCGCMAPTRANRPRWPTGTPPPPIR
jgi:transcriptional regulator with XRE-family HTH domain